MTLWIMIDSLITSYFSHISPLIQDNGKTIGNMTSFITYISYICICQVILRVEKAFRGMIANPCSIEVQLAREYYATKEASFRKLNR
jgi:hypothetical protein